ncbi:hypothetical protein GOBAR_AA07209 [Gossypium barbadense]|uniref:Endoplasmic reticulum vesicle transporter C-terminal domain-containing protein n=1 Tax=Gossypium barbadense TaxID=3634 RepID=A0A2P5YCU2_GOSBA|nr:hypothetical protein GOBAR_AA07209 [Gossypium barbadense]
MTGVLDHTVIKLTVGIQRNMFANSFHICQNLATTSSQRNTSILLKTTRLPNPVLFFIGIFLGNVRISYAELTENLEEIDKKEEDGPEANYKKPGCVSSYGGTFVTEDAIGSTCLGCWFSDNGHAVYSRAYVLPNNIHRSRVASIDAIDLSGKHEVDLDTNIWKLRLNSHGHIIGTKYLSDLVEKQHTTRNHASLFKIPGYVIWSCYFCLVNTNICSLLLMAWDAKAIMLGSFDKRYDKEHHDGSAKKPHKFSFDKDAENMINKVKKALENGEGCRVYGVLDVQRVAGNFHISVHALNIYVAQMVNNFFSQHCNFVSHPNS